MSEKLIKLDYVIQELLELYKKGSIKLTEMEEFLENIKHD